MGKYKVCIFDLDGTLLNTLEDLRHSINYIAKKHTFKTLTSEEILPTLGYGLEAMLRDCLKISFEEPDFQKIYKEFLIYYKEHQNTKTCIYDGILEMLHALKNKGYKLLIISNKRRKYVEGLSHHHFGSLIDLALGEDQENGYPLKPKPEGVLKAIELLAASKESCVYIGDSEVDYHTANNAKIDFIAVSWGFRTKEALEKLNIKCIASTPEDLYQKITR